MDNAKTPSHSAWADVLRKIRARTSARIFVERGATYSTQMQLELSGAHARAVDAVWMECDLRRDFSSEFVAEWRLFECMSQAVSRSQFLLRPDLG